MQLGEISFFRISLLERNKVLTVIFDTVCMFTDLHLQTAEYLSILTIHSSYN